ncbi:hypothetical protein [Streptomyces sp. NPDC050485]|uniref:hypothetical protein n=1 Tax=Streptomyces sp. NPDC050485 TaxID=3365617 RepID=UPI003792066D
MTKAMYRLGHYELVGGHLDGTTMCVTGPGVSVLRTVDANGWPSYWQRLNPADLALAARILDDCSDHLAMCRDPGCTCGDQSAQ